MILKIRRALIELLVEKRLGRAPAAAVIKWLTGRPPSTSITAPPRARSPTAVPRLPRPRPTSPAGRSFSKSAPPPPEVAVRRRRCSIRALAGPVTRDARRRRRRPVVIVVAAVVGARPVLGVAHGGGRNGAGTRWNGRVARAGRVDHGARCRKGRGRERCAGGSGGKGGAGAGAWSDAVWHCAPAPVPRAGKRNDNPLPNASVWGGGGCVGGLFVPAPPLQASVGHGVAVSSPPRYPPAAPHLDSHRRPPPLPP